jgi:hypothetical protein
MQNAVVVNGVLARNVDYGATISNFGGSTRKTQENIAIADLTDWSFAKKANEQLKR